MAKKYKMGPLEERELHMPLNGASNARLRAAIERIVSRQTTAATSVDTFYLSGKGTIRGAKFIFAAAAEEGESLAIDIKVNGTSVLAGGSAITLDDSSDLTPAVWNYLDIDQIKLKPNDVLTIHRTYTAGEAPEPIGSNQIELEYA